MTENLLFSPWRSLHIESFKDAHQPVEGPGSVFSRIAASDDDDANLVIWRGETVFVVMNLYPYNNGHLLIVPFREVAAYTDLTNLERGEMADAVGHCMRWLDLALKPEGYNVGLNIGTAAGAGVPRHLHTHVVPRWAGDTNFMPVTADTKVIPEAMQESFGRIRAAAVESGP